MTSGRAVQEELRELMTQPGRHEEDNALMIGLLIIKGWLAQYLRPAPMPCVVHRRTGEPWLFNTDPARCRIGQRWEPHRRRSPMCRASKTAVGIARSKAKTGRPGRR
jgi:hypothetical protein